MLTPEALLAEFMGRFRKDAAEGQHLVCQITLTGDGGGTWHITVKDQECSLATGPADRPDVAFTLTVDDWAELTAGRLDAYNAFMQGRVEVAGDLSVAMRLQQLFTG